MQPLGGGRENEVIPSLFERTGGTVRGAIPLPQPVEVVSTAPRAPDAYLVTPIGLGNKDRDAIRDALAHGVCSGRLPPLAEDSLSVASLSTGCMAWVSSPSRKALKISDDEASAEE